jgi:hypothetical protein
MPKPRRTLTNCLSVTVRIEIPMTLDVGSLIAARASLDTLASHLPAGSTVDVLGEPRFGRMPAPPDSSPDSVPAPSGERAVESRAAEDSGYTQNGKDGEADKPDGHGRPAHNPPPHDQQSASHAATPPSGYGKLPDGAKCRCLNLWADGTDYYCCNPDQPDPVTVAASELPAAFDRRVPRAQ